MDSIIKLKEISKTYPVSGQALNVIRSVSLTMAKGELISIIGPSGSGKTTLLNLMGGLTRPDTGRVFIAGADIWEMDDDRRSSLRNREIGFIYQFASLIPSLTAVENILLPTAFGKERADRMPLALELLSSVGLNDRIDAYPSHLSGGQQRRVAIARAFINEPGIILADEPTGDLDEETEKEIVRFLKAMNDSKGISIVLVTHSKEIASNAFRRFMLEKGALKELA